MNLKWKVREGRGEWGRGGGREGGAITLVTEERYLGYILNQVTR